MLGPAKKPVILAGVELHRFGLTDLAIKIAEQFNIPIAADLSANRRSRKTTRCTSACTAGRCRRDQHVRDYVESSDCVLMLGHVHHRHEPGHLHRQARPRRTMLATTESIKVGYHQYDDVEFADYLKASRTAVSKQAPCRRRSRASVQAPQPARASRSR